MLARKGNKDPANPANQVSPAYLYSTVRNALASGCHTANDMSQNSCNGKKECPLGNRRDRTDPGDRAQAKTGWRAILLVSSEGAFGSCENA